jgi:hypothetical protein
LNLSQKIHLKLRGWYEDGDKTFMECSVHGLTEVVECPKCVKERLRKTEN